MDRTCQRVHNTLAENDCDYAAYVMSGDTGTLMVRHTGPHSQEIRGLAMLMANALQGRGQ